MVGRFNVPNIVANVFRPFLQCKQSNFFIRVAMCRWSASFEKEVFDSTSSGVENRRQMDTPESSQGLVFGLRSLVFLYVS
jgi:hypothetical protein